MNPLFRPTAPLTLRSMTHWAGRPVFTGQVANVRPLIRCDAVLSPPPRDSAPVTDIESALQAACSALGRPYGAQEQALAERLKANWYTQLADLAAMDTEEAAALQVPLRLLKQMQVQLGQHAHIAPAEADPATPPSPIQDGTLQPTPAAMAKRSNGKTVDMPNGTLEDWIGEIEQRQAPAAGRFGFGCVHAAGRVRVKTVERRSYSLRPAEMSAELVGQLDALHRFLTVPFFGAQAAPIAAVTARKTNDHIRMMLGWMHYERGVPKDKLTLEALVPSGERDGVKVFFDYSQWLANERQVSVFTLTLACRALIQLARFLYHYRSSVRPGTGVLPYSDVPVLQEMRVLQNMYRKKQKMEPRASDESKKFVEWPEFLWAVEELQRECARYNVMGKPRKDTAVAWALQRYLIFAILACVPDRQRTIRELRVGKTLVKSEDGRWYIRHGPSDYKTGRVYGPRPALLVSPNLYPELEVYIHRWRASLQPKHDFLFTQRCGKPLTDTSLYRLFTTTSYRLLGRKLNPHMVRDSVVTYFRSSDCSERQLEALALYMGHSLQEQRQTYDRRTLSQKVEPAIELLAAMMTGDPEQRSRNNGGA